MRKCITIMIIIAILLFNSLVFANTRDLSFETEVASSLSGLGLFKGVSENDYALDKQPTRIEAIVMVIRLMGKEDDALSRNWQHPFSDVPSWADRYVGYAYEHDLAKGISDTEFGTDSVSSTAYLTYMLRALGYVDTYGLDFVWDNPYDLANELGLLPTFIDRDNFLRADAVCVSYAALSCRTKSNGKFLCINLINDDIIDQNIFNVYYEFGFLSKKDEYANKTSTNSNVYDSLDVVSSITHNTTDSVSNSNDNYTNNYTNNNTFSNIYNSYDNNSSTYSTPAITYNQRNVPNLYTNNWKKDKIQDFIEDMAEEFEDSVVLVASTDGLGNISFGTAFFINDDNYAITNYHVVKNNYAILVAKKDDAQICSAYVVNYDSYNDIALLYIDGMKGYEYLKLDLDYEVNDYAFTCGYPEDETHSISDNVIYKTTSGIIIDKSAYSNGKYYIKTDNDTTHGNSGGPLLNGNLGVIGIVTLKDTLNGNIYSIPSKQLVDFVNKTDFDEFESSLKSIRKNEEKKYSNSSNSYKTSYSEQPSYYNQKQSYYNDYDSYEEVEKITVNGTVNNNTSMNLVYNKNEIIGYGSNLIKITNISSYRPTVKLLTGVDMAKKNWERTGGYSSPQIDRIYDQYTYLYFSLEGTFKISQKSSSQATIPVNVYVNGSLVYTNNLYVDITGKVVGDSVKFIVEDAYIPVRFNSTSNYQIRLGNI